MSRIKAIVARKSTQTETSISIIMFKLLVNYILKKLRDLRKN